MKRFILCAFCFATTTTVCATVMPAPSLAPDTKNAPPVVQSSQTPVDSATLKNCRYLGLDLKMHPGVKLLVANQGWSKCKPYNPPPQDPNAKVKGFE